MLNLKKNIHTYRGIPMLRYVVFLIVFWLFQPQLLAQINNNRFKVDVTSDDMGPCGGSNDAWSQVAVTAKNSTVHNFEITFDLPDGVRYIGGDFEILSQQGSGDFIVTETDLSNLNTPVFRIERPSDANWQVADRVQFRFNKTASCDAVQFSYAGGLFKDAHTITYDDLNGSQTVSDNDPTINSYNFFRAYLAVQNYNSIIAQVGNVVNRPLEITNSGNGTISEFIHNVVIDSNIESYELWFNGAALSPTSVSGNSYTYTVNLSQAPYLGNIGNGDTNLENETVFFEEHFIVNGCDENSITHQPIWGCNTSEICQIPEPLTGSVSMDTEIPTIRVIEIGDPARTDLCLPTARTVRIENQSATTIAYNVEINTGYGPSSSVRTTYTVNGLFGNDRPSISKGVGNFRFGNNPIIALPQRPTTQFSGVGAGSYFIADDYFTTDPDGPGGLEDLDGDGFFDDLAANASTDLSYEETNDPLSSACGVTNSRYLQDFRLLTDAYAQNQCTVNTLTSRALVKYNLFDRRTVLTDGTTDISNGQPFTASVQGSLAYVGFEALYCNGVRIFSNDPSSSWTVTLNVPDGISLSGTPIGYTQINANTIVYTTTNLPITSNLNLKIDFPLVMDCSVYSGPQEVPISYVTRFECSCFAEDIHCGVISGIRADCDPSCNGPVINNFDAQRETAGWTDSSMSTKVVLDPTIHNLDTYMAKDEMVIHTSMIMNNANIANLLFDLSYNTVSLAAGGSDIIQFVDGTITINDISTGSPITVPLDAAIPPILTSNGTTTHSLAFDLSSYTSHISPTYTYGEPAIVGGLPEADEVSLELHFVFKETFTPRTLFELNNFSGEFYNNDLLGNKVECTSRGDRVRYFRNVVNPYDRPSTTITGCTQNYVELLVQLLTATGGDKFPDEFRPYFIWDATDVEIPSGTTFTGLVTSIDYPGTDPSTNNGGLIATQSGNTVTVTPGPSLREWDVGTNHVPRIRVYFQGNNTTPTTSSISWTNSYRDFAYATVPEALTDTDSHNVNFRVPNFEITTATPIVSGDSDTATFETTLCMNSTTNLPFNWVQIHNGSDFTVNRVYELVSTPSGTNSSPLPFTESGGNTWVQLGGLNSSTNSCKTFYYEVDYTNCSNFNFTVENAWSCFGYPTDYSLESYQNPLTLLLEPKEAVLQIAILDEPSSSVDICSNFNIDLELRNAGNGDLVSPSVTFDIPGDATSLILNGVTVEYPQNSGDHQTVNTTLLGNTVTLNLLEHTAIAANNAIRGSLNASTIDEQIALIQLDLSVQCNFTSNTAITYTAHGDNTCGEPARGSGSRLSTNPIVVTGADASYDAITNISVPAGGVFEGCTTETITIETTIVGGPSSNLDYARIVLPDGLAFDATTFTSNNATYPVTYTSVTTIGDHQEIIVNMPDGANNGANPSYSFDVTTKNTTTSCSPSTRIEVYNFVITSSLICGAVSCGTTEIAVGDTFENIIITKPELIESIFASNADYITDRNGNYTYHIEFGVENTGTIAIDSGFEYNIYCADAIGVKTGASIFSGTINQPIAAGNSIIEDLLFTTSNFCGDSSTLIVEFVPSDNNCHCDILAIPLATEPELADLEVLQTVDISNAYIGDTVTFTIDVLNNGPFDAENIIVEDIVPAGFTVVNINDGGTVSGNTIRWPTFNLPNGASTTFTFTATVNTPSGALDEFTSIAQVVAVDEYDPNSTPDNYDGLPLENDEAIASVHVLTADISLTKGLSATSSPIPTIGETITFEVHVVNNGPDAANTVRVEDIVPSGFTVNSATINNSGVLSGNIIIWNIALLNTTANLVLSYDATVNIPTGVVDEFTNIAQVAAADEYDPNSIANNFDSSRPIEDDEAVFVTSLQTSDLELENTITPVASDPGDIVVVSVEITNNGPNDATGVVIENIVPVGLSVVNVANSGTLTGDNITWIGLNIPNGTSVILTFTATVNTPSNVSDEYLNTAQVTAVNQYDLDSFPNNDDGDQSEDDEDNAVVLPITADLSLTKGLSATSNSTPNTGEAVIFELVLTNQGPDVATNVTIEDNIPSGYTIGTVNDGGIVSGNTISWEFSSLAVGSQTLSYELTLNAPTSSLNEYTNIAQVISADQYDPNSIPNNDDGDQSEDDEASHTIASPTVDIAITKTADKAGSFFKDTIKFSVIATNNSLYEATNIGIEDVLPAGFALVSQTADLGAYNEAISTWEIPSLLPGASASLEMTVTVTETEAYTNIAQLIYLDQIDDNISNDSDQVTIIVTQEECLTVFNEFSPNSDGANDTFFIECIEQYPNNTLQVFNRWGTKVFEAQNYDNSWDGTSTGRATINASEKLPVGTYYYTLEPGDGSTPPKAGWLYINR